MFRSIINRSKAGVGSLADVHGWLDNYRDTNTAEGWIENGIISFVHLVHDALEQSKVPGGAFEVGVHHGKFFMPLNGIVESRYKSIALDLYDQQDLNIDYSGRGDKERFASNLRTFDRHAGRNVLIEAGDSTAIKADDLLRKAGSHFKVLSVDGGHTAEHTISDIILADQIMHPRGFVFVDDILNYHWLGVIDGVTTYLKTRPRLWPLAIGHNKLLMCRMSVHQQYRNFFQQNGNFTKTTQLCGYDILAV